MKYRSDETWHRLLEWTNGSARSERLAAQVLYEAGYKDIDPSHPLGGKDGGKDALCTRDGKSWIMAVYFPRGQKGYADIKSKFLSDSNGVLSNGADGIVFVTNQELRLSERSDIESLTKCHVDIFHLERVASILDKPVMAGIRGQFLDIDFSNEDLKQAFRKTLAETEERIAGNQLGGDTFCYSMLYHFSMESSLAHILTLIKKGHYPLYDVRMSIVDMNSDSGKDIFHHNWGELSAPAQYVSLNWSLSEHEYYRIFFHARNGQWHQDLQLKRSNKHACWLAATQVSDTLGKPRFDFSDVSFIDEFGAPIWRQ